METEKELQKIGFAIIGTGSIAHKHAEGILKNKGAELVAVRSRDKERAEAFAQKYNIKAYTDYNELLKNPRVNAVDLVGVNNTHAELGMIAAHAKKHVLVEKPIAVSMKEAEELIETCKKNNVKLSVISQKRFDKAAIKLKKAIENAELGKITMARASVKWSRNKRYYDSSQGWRKSLQEAGGGFLLVQAIHHIDLLLWMLGDVESVYGKTETKLQDMECEDTAAAIIKFKNGAIATIEGTSTVVKNRQDKLEINGDNGSVILTGNKYLHWISVWEFNKGRLASFLNKIKNLRYIMKGSIGEQIADFVEAVQNNKEPQVTGEDGKKALEIILAIYKSASLKKEVALTK